MKTKIRNGIKYVLKNSRWTRPPEECKYCGRVRKIVFRNMCGSCYARWSHHIKRLTESGYEEKFKEYRRNTRGSITRNKKYPHYRFNKTATGFLCGYCGKAIKGFTAGIPSKKHDLKCPFCGTRFKYNELKKVKFDRITWEVVEVLE